jgi:hypothetical protein
VDRHVDLLALLCQVSAFVAAVAGFALLPLAAAALALRAGGDAPDFPARFTAGLIASLGLMLLVYAGAAASTGRGLRRRLRYARTSCLVLGAVNLFVPPFGTAFGAYALWVLLRVDPRDWQPELPERSA